MTKFEITILGCGAALPTLRHFTTTQVLNVHEKFFMLDCCEAAQILFLQADQLKFGKLDHIFISHRSQNASTKTRSWSSNPSP